MNLSKLSEPFPAEDIEWRIGMSGINQNGVWAKALAYITARAIHDRLDEVCGPGNWQMRYVEHLGATVCEIGIYYNSQWIWKAGGSDQTQFEAFKGGLSGAEKRAGVPWGIGRYLYKLTETFVKCSEKKTDDHIHYQGFSKGKSNKPDVPAFFWATPELPDWALPKPEVLPGTKLWDNAITAYLRDGNLDKVKSKALISEENEKLLIKEAKGE